MGYTFDGVNKLIILDPGTLTLVVSDMYSRWKDWAKLSDNTKYAPAFANSIGGESLGGGVTVGGYFFLQNGWLVRPQEADHTLTVSGNMFPIPDTAALFTPTLGAYTVNIVMRTSSLSQTISTGGGSGGGLTAEQAEILNQARDYSRISATKPAWISD